ncbi:MAG: cyclopropane fatty acyl phospholipid synthase [Balneolaceae bacterium]
MAKKEKNVIEGYLSEAGIRINGRNPWDLQVHDDRLYGRILAGGSLAAGESYMEGWWDAAKLDKFFEKVLETKLNERFYRSFPVIWLGLKNKMFNAQTVKRSYKVGREHYDRGIELFSRMLDKRLIYSCGYWKNTETLDQAQENKLDLICRKLELKPGMRLLDIGCGWGGLLKYAAENYGVKGTGITVSKDQANYSRESCKGLPITINLMDYRKLNEPFDRIASVGMTEHVGAKNYKAFMKAASRCLKDDGLFLVHTIGSNCSVTHTDPWIEKYIFPNSMLPSLAQLTDAAEPFFRMEDLHSFGPYYDRTLMAWDQNFRNTWDELQEKYDEPFYRMWRYYLMSSAASFRTRQIQLWQILFANPSRKTMVETIR